MTRRRPRALAISASREKDRSALKWVGLAGLVAGSILATVSLARAEGHEEVTVTHAFSNFGSLKYGPDFPHLNYVNPDAPKGGEISTWAQGNFDSFNNYTRKGVPGSGMALLFENVLVSTADDAYGTYCYLCTTMEFPESKDWVIFNLREDVTFADGTPATAEDAKFTFDLFMEQGLPEYVNVVKGFVSSVELLDTYRIKYNFAEKAPRREVIGFAGGIPVFSKAWFEESGARIDESTLEPFLGTGPYVLESQAQVKQLL